MDDRTIIVYDIFIEEVLKEDVLSWMQCWLRFQHGMHFIEIADRSDLSSEAVRRRICKITDRVKERTKCANIGDRSWDKQG